MSPYNGQVWVGNLIANDGRADLARRCPTGHSHGSIVLNWTLSSTQLQASSGKNAKNVGNSVHPRNFPFTGCGIRMIDCGRSSYRLPYIYSSSLQFGNPRRIILVVALASNDSGSNGPRHSMKDWCFSYSGSAMALRYS